MTVTGIASSSSGNAYVVSHGNASILIDCGVPYARLKEHSFDAVLITHSHADHIQGLVPLLHKRDVPVYANALTAETIIKLLKVDESAFACFENGQPFEVGPFTVSAFSIPHDTSDPVGYLVRVGGDEPCTYFHGTDIGTPLDAIGVKLAEANIATLESNHDPVMLRTSGRSPSLIQRIAGPRGHLSNDQAADLVRRFATPRLRQINLAHLSHDCNAPHLAERSMRSALDGKGLTAVELRIFL